MNRMTRREVMEMMAAGLALGARAHAGQEAGAGGVPVRPFGKTGEKLSIIGLGGWDIGAVKDDAEAIAIMHEAEAEGINFFDNCWEYHNGRSEELMGRALEGGGRRDRVFLMTKVCARDYARAKAQLEESLRRLRTDRIDLWQFHGIRWDEDAGLIFDGKNGAVRAALEARQAGKIRHIGFTGHKDPKFHLGMLALPFDQGQGGPFEWASIQMPLNILDPHYHSFQKEVLPECVKRGIPVFAMKSLAAQGGRIPRELPYTAEVCRRYVLSLPVCSLVCGIMSRENLRQDLAIARNFVPMTPAEMESLVAGTAEAGKDGHIELYKTADFGCTWSRKHPIQATIP